MPEIVVGRVGIDQTTDGTTNKVQARNANHGDLQVNANLQVNDIDNSVSNPAFTKITSTDVIPPSQRLGNQLLCAAGGLTVAAGGGTANSYSVDVAYFTRKTALIKVTGANVTAELVLSDQSDIASNAYSPVPIASYQWTLNVGSHAIPIDIQCNYACIKFTNADAENAAVITGVWQLKEV